MDKYIEQYCNLVKKLVPNSLLKTHIEKKTSFNKDFGIIEKGMKSMSKYRKLCDGMWLEYKIDGIDISYINDFVVKINKGFEKNSDQMVTILGELNRLKWDYKKEADYTKSIVKEYLKTSSEIKLLSIETVLNESYEYLLSSDYKFEFRDNSYLSIVFKIKCKTKDELNITIDRNTDMEVMRQKIHKKLMWIETINRLDRIQLENTELDSEKKIICVSEPEFSGRLIHETIGRLTEADVYIQNRNSFTRLGKKHSDIDINIVDYANGEHVPNQYYIDEEGTIAKNITVMESGNIVGLLSDNQSRLTKHHNISGCLRSSLDSNYPLIRMRNTAILPGDFEYSSIIKSIDNGLLLKEYVSGHLNYNNEFTIVVKNAVVVRNGEAVGVIDEVKLRSNIFEFISSIDMIGKDFDWFSHSNYSKEDCVVSISFGSATIRSKLNLDLPQESVEELRS